MELLLAQDISTNTIYTDEALPTIAPAIVLQDRVIEYQVKVYEDISVSFDTSKLTEFDKYNCEFTLFLISEGTHVVNFTGCDIQQIQIFRGITKIEFKHIIGRDLWYSNIVQVGTVIPEFLIINNSYYVRSNMFGVSTCDQVPNYVDCVRPFYCITDPTTPNAINVKLPWLYDATTVEIYACCPCPTVITQINIHVGTDLTLNLMKTMTVYGSNDKSNWTEVFSIANITYDTAQEIKHYTPTIQKPFKTYKFVCTATNPNIVLWPMTLIGYKCKEIGNQHFHIYPRISAAVNGYELDLNTADGITETYSRYLLVNDLGYASFSRSSASVPFIINYKFPMQVNFEGFLVRANGSSSSQFCNGWFKWQGSNDGETWTDLIELRHPFSDYWRDGMFLFYMSRALGKYSQIRIVIYTVYDETKNQLVMAMLSPLYSIDGEYVDFESIVPVMMSNEQDGYVLSASSVAAGQVYYMYDRDDNTLCQGTISDGQWITTIDMGVNTVVQGISLKGTSSTYGQMPITFSVQCSTDNDTWQILQSYALGANYWDANNLVATWTVDNTTGYRYYRIVVTAVQDSNTTVKINEIGWSTISGQIPIDYWVDDYLVPVMSSNSQDGYIASASSEYNSSTKACNAFDRNRSTLWGTIGKTNQWLKIQLPTAKIMNACSFTARSDGYLNETPTSFNIQGSNDDSNWTTLLSVENTTWSLGLTRSFDVDNTTAYLYYKFNIIANGGGNNCNFAEVTPIYRTYYEQD